MSWNRSIYYRREDKENRNWLLLFYNHFKSTLVLDFYVFIVPWLFQVSVTTDTSFSNSILSFVFLISYS